MTKRNIDAVLFDLDGTLVDTAPDLASALNATLIQFEKAPLAFEAIRPVVSHGARGLISLGFNIEPDNEKFNAIKDFLLNYYAANLAEHSSLFEGMDELLNSIEESGRTWGVVTNKPGWLTTPLMSALNLAHRAAVVVSGDTTAQRKPHPEPLYFACEKISTQSQRCLYFGDAERDIAAGNAAGMKTLVAGFGYIADSDSPKLWNAHAIVESPTDAWPYINL